MMNNLKQKAFDEMITEVNAFEPRLKGVEPAIREIMGRYIDEAKAEAIQECIKLSDDIEMREPDGGTKQWMAFKGFRNAMRDRLVDEYFAEYGKCGNPHYTNRYCMLCLEKGDHQKDKMFRPAKSKNSGNSYD